MTISKLLEEEEDDDEGEQGEHKHQASTTTTAADVHQVEWEWDEAGLKRRLKALTKGQRRSKRTAKLNKN